MEHRRDIVDKVSKEIYEWIEYVITPRDELGAMCICPFAKQAKVNISHTILSDITPKEGVDVAIFVVGDDITYDVLIDARNELNRKYKEYIFLEDHMDDPSYINGVQSNFGRANLILCQKRDELLRARNTLGKTEYYKYWSKEMYRSIVHG